VAPNDFFVGPAVIRNFQVSSLVYLARRSDPGFQIISEAQKERHADITDRQRPTVCVVEIGAFLERQRTKLSAIGVPGE
jgi:hypothetical protein